MDVVSASHVALDHWLVTVFPHISNKREGSLTEIGDTSPKSRQGAFYESIVA